MSEQGFEAWHVGDVDLRDAPDSAIWDNVVTNDFIIVTKDEDFAERSGRILRVRGLYGSVKATRPIEHYCNGFGHAGTE